MVRGKPVAWCAALGALLGVARADVSHYGAMAERLALEGEAAYHAHDVPRALEAFTRLGHYDGDYGPARLAMLRTAQILLSRSSPKLSGARDKAVLLLRYAAGTPDAARAVEPSPGGIAAAEEATRALAALHVTAAPLSSSSGHRAAGDAKLPRAGAVIVDAMRAAHAAIPALAAGRYLRELGILRADWQDPAKAALRQLLAARGSLDDDTRLAIILAACADSRDEGRSYEPPPCEVLHREWPDVGRGLSARLRPLVTDLDPGWRHAAQRYLAAEGALADDAAQAVRGHFLADVEGDEQARAEKSLPAFAGQPFAAHRGVFEEVLRGWVERGRGEKNPFPWERRLSFGYRALAKMGDEGRAYVRAVAADPQQDGLARAGAAWALACGGEREALLPLAAMGGDLIPAAIAVGIDACKAEALLPVLGPILRGAGPGATLDAARTLKRASWDGACRRQAPVVVELAGVTLARANLGRDARYVHQEAIEALDHCDHPDLVRAAARLSTDDPYLLERWLQLLQHKVSIDPDTAAEKIKPYLEHPVRPVMRAAQRAMDAVDDLRRPR